MAQAPADMPLSAAAATPGAIGERPAPACIRQPLASYSRSSPSRPLHSSCLRLFFRFRQRFFERAAAPRGRRQPAALAQVTLPCASAARLTQLQRHPRFAHRGHLFQGLLQRGGDSSRGEKLSLPPRKRCGARFFIVDLRLVTAPPPLLQYVVVSLATGLLLSVRFLLSSIAKSEQVACACPSPFCFALTPLRMLLLPPRLAHKKENEARHAGVHASPLHTRAAYVDHTVVVPRNRTQRLHVCESRVEVLWRTMRAAAFKRSRNVCLPVSQLGCLLLPPPTASKRCATPRLHHRARWLLRAPPTRRRHTRGGRRRAGAVAARRR
jgi:hypothetical protein